MPTEGKSTSIRFNDEDNSIIEWLQSKLGIATSQVVKIAIRRLYEAEGGPKKKGSK